MSSPTVHFTGFSDRCFPRSGLPGKYLRDNETPDQALEQIMKRLCAAKLYDKSEKVWTPQVRGHEMSKEQSIASFFNQILRESAIGDSGQYVWLAHDSQMCEGRRKPDIILIPQSYKTVEDVPFSAMLSYCECKYNYTQKVGMKALHQLLEIAGYATASQFGWRFYVGITLCRRQLSVAVFIRGLTYITMPWSINANPEDFLTVLLTLSDGSPARAGFDSLIAIDLTGTFSHSIHFESITTSITMVCPLTRTSGMEGRGTVTCVCEGEFEGRSEPQECVLKETWVNADWLHNIRIHEYLNGRPPTSIHESDLHIFRPADEYQIFEGCMEAADSWDDTKFLPGIPIITDWCFPFCEYPTGIDKNGRDQLEQKPDTTKNIAARFILPGDPPLYFEPRIHICTLSRTCCIPITMFSCCREFINAMIGALVSHFNGFRKAVLHCDVSESNVWMRVLSLATKDVVPNWPDQGFIKRAGVLGDWGSAQDLLMPNQDKTKHGFVMGTFPFIATKLLKVMSGAEPIMHSMHHDLESFFWVFWSVAVKSAGPYNQCWKWKLPNQRSTMASSQITASHVSSGPTPFAVSIEDIFTSASPSATVTLHPTSNPSSSAAAGASLPPLRTWFL
ncbi:hypothetical protein EDC04DRAFT_3063756 [Pisolithus marmoratus]|nr:hypothetical protein EDC04DRAFT_3063756 [Pisolithus marmoratus]